MNMLDEFLFTYDGSPLFHEKKTLTCICAHSCHAQKLQSIGSCPFLVFVLIIYFIVSLWSLSLSSMQMVSEEPGHNESHATKKLPVEALIFEDIHPDAQQVSKIHRMVMWIYLVSAVAGQICKDVKLNEFNPPPCLHQVANYGLYFTLIYLFLFYNTG